MASQSCFIYYQLLALLSHKVILKEILESCFFIYQNGLCNFIFNCGETPGLFQVGLLRIRTWSTEFAQHLHAASLPSTCRHPPHVPILRSSWEEGKFVFGTPKLFLGVVCFWGFPPISSRHLEIVYLLPNEEFSFPTNSDSLKKRGSRDERAGGLQDGRAPRCFCAQRGLTFGVRIGRGLPTALRPWASHSASPGSGCLTCPRRGCLFTYRCLSFAHWNLVFSVSCSSKMPST